MNPFNLTGWETTVITAIACATAIACTIIGGRNIVEFIDRICSAGVEIAHVIFGEKKQ